MLTITADVRSSLELIGWSLLHFVWQGAVLAIMLAVTLGLVRRSAARVREQLALITLGLMGLCPLVDVWWLGREATTTGIPVVSTTSPLVEPAVSLLAVANPLVDNPDEPVISVPMPQPALVSEPMVVDSPQAPEIQRPPLPPSRSPVAVSGWLPWLAVAWLGGVLGLSLRLVMGWRVVQRLRRLATPITAGPWRVAFDVLLARMKYSRPILLAESVLVEVPTVIGWWSPVILVPASLLSGMSSHEMAAILAHELAHIRRHDYLINLCQTVVETLLFYHPAVWWVSNQIRQEREQACDDEAVASCGDVVTYARALLAVEEHRLTRSSDHNTALVVAASGGSLRERVFRLIDPESARPQTPGPASFVIVAAVALLIGAMSVATQASGELGSDQPPPKTAQDKGLANDPSGSATPDLAPAQDHKQQVGPWRPLLRSDLAQDLSVQRDHVYAVVDGDPIYVLDEFQEHEIRHYLSEAKKTEADPKDILLRRFKYELWKTEPQYNPAVRHLLVKKARPELSQEELDAIEVRVINESFRQIDHFMFTVLQQDYFRQSMNRKLEQGIVDAYLQKNGEKQPKPTEADIKAVYDKNYRHRYYTPEGTKWQRIDVNYDKYATREMALAAANSLRQEIDNGLSFTTAATQKSDSSLAAVSGLSYWMPRSEVNALVDEKLKEAILTLPEEQVSSVIATETCYTIIRIVGRRQEDIDPLAQVSAQISAEISKARAGQANQRLIDELIKKADIHSIVDRDWDEYCASHPRISSQVKPSPPKLGFRPLLKKDIELGIPLESDHVVAIADGYPFYAVDFITKEEYQRVIDVEKKAGKISGKDILRDWSLIFTRDPFPYRFLVVTPYRDRPFANNILVNHLLAKKYKQILSPTELAELQAKAERAFRSHLLDRGVQLRILDRDNVDLDSLGPMIYGDLLESYRKQFINGEFAVAYIEHIARSQPEPTEQEVRAKYKSQFSLYYTPEGTKYQRVDLNYNKYPTREAALAAANALRQEILDGFSFHIAATTRSDSHLTAIRGISHWMPLAEVNELVDKPVQEAVKTLPEGEVSSVLELQSCYSIIRVIGRRKESMVPFEKVSARLSKDIKTERVEKSQQNLLANLLWKASIHTIFDSDWDEYWRRAGGQSSPAD